VRARTTKAKRDGAVGRILRGESTVEEEARKLHVQPRALRSWVTMAKNGTRVGRKSLAPEEAGTASDSSAVGSDEGPASSPRLERALRSAELDNGAESDEDESDPIGGAIPPPDPEELVAFTETVRGQMLKLYAGVVGLSPDDPRVELVLSFTDRERATLKLWAPYAAKYVPVLIGKSEEVGAWIFVGVNVASLWTGMATLRRMAPKKTARDPADRFGTKPPPTPVDLSNGPEGPIER
jgi:transposase-like protein